MFVCMYVYICICMYVYVCIYVCMCMYVYTYVCMCMYVCITKSHTFRRSILPPTPTPSLHSISDLVPICSSFATGRAITRHVTKFDVPWLVVVTTAACLVGRVDGSSGNGLL
jgi:hypothetical protein